MFTHEIKVQACGCISLPDEISALLAIVPGAVLHLTTDPEHRTVALLARPPNPHDAAAAERVACPTAAPSQL